MDSPSYGSLSVTSISVDMAGKSPPKRIPIPTTATEESLAAKNSTSGEEERNIDDDADVNVDLDADTNVDANVDIDVDLDVALEEDGVLLTLTNLTLHPKVTDGFTFNWVKTHQEFSQLIEGCQRAIDRNIYPIRIGQGSSGSYFVRDEAERIVGVFKPKDEEPYGHLNPKWIKWLHRTCCPCLFGRSFLVPNAGYISEAAASMVDIFLGLDMVPRTQIAHLSASSFVFPWWEHYRVWRERAENPVARYPLKLGSFQLFVEGFENSSAVISRLDDLRPLEPGLKKAFQLEFEKMTILDYAIRNTDRSFDNWLIHLSWSEREEEKKDKDAHMSSFSCAPSTTNLDKTLKETASSDTDLLRSPTPRLVPKVKIACIDNGLAFPLKHPDEFRSYPYSWVHLPESRIPYSEELCSALLPRLSDPATWELLISQLRQIFQIDSDFNERIFRKQMAILRGQLHNILHALQERESPAQLVERTLLLIEEDDEPIGEAFDDTSTVRRKRHRHTPVTGKALFTCW